MFIVYLTLNERLNSGLRGKDGLFDEDLDTNFESTSPVYFQKSIFSTTARKCIYLIGQIKPNAYSDKYLMLKCTLQNVSDMHSLFGEVDTTKHSQYHE